MKKLADANRDVLVELLRERLAAERIALALYERLLDPVARKSLPEDADVADALAGLKEQEVEHVAFLERELGRLGTAGFTLLPVSLRGFDELARDPGAGLHDLVGALRDLELVEDAGWDVLQKLARDVQDREAAQAFEQRSREERAHALLLRDIAHLLERQRLKTPEPKRLAA